MKPTSQFPLARPRRNRKADWARRLVRETELCVNDLILPLIVHDGDGGAQPIASMPGISRHSFLGAIEQAKIAADLGIPMLAIFPHIDANKKDAEGREALNEKGLVPTLVAQIKAQVPNIGIMCDVALDPYTDHGHDGLIDENGYMLNDETVNILVKQALIQAQAGCDVIAPSDMCDGRIGLIRRELEAAGFHNTQIMAYAAKFASAFYGPYRDAIGSQGALKGDKKTYQMDPQNSDEALVEVALDIEEGADMLLVKPGMPYLDILRRIKDEFGRPTFAFQVSGEYAMLEAAIQNGWLDGARVRMEALQCFKRAGADGIISYWALEAAKELGRK
ncbi:MAG: porphobilinogen synthase [Hyphomonadaceae bacterium]|nr:MAG: porphobilinogen synthase [Hyphomonadaceae bacterium]KAF0186413.1 MAG: porphobilinogen synthase [Hyphomonadaceae bacterium]